jgi:hypothetical protein
MAGLYGEWQMPDGQWAVVKQLDRHDLMELADALPEWAASGSP